MPHLIQFEKEAGHEAIVKAFGSQVGFENWLKEAIALAYDLFASEVLDVTKEIITHELIEVHSMPIDLCIQIDTWYNTDREREAANIENFIRQHLHKALQAPCGITTNAYLTVVKETTPQDVAGWQTLDPIFGYPGGM